VVVPDEQQRVERLRALRTTLTTETPVTLKWDNGAGLIFRNTISVDSNYLFTVAQSIENTGSGDVALYPFSRIVRQGKPHVQNFFVMHEGPLGVLGSNNLVSLKYDDVVNEKDSQKTVDSNGGWVGVTDKYWATAVLSEPGAPLTARFSATPSGAINVFQTSFVETTPVLVPAGGSAENKIYVFAGAKREGVISSYEKTYGFDRLRAADRLGLVLVLHQAAVLPDAISYKGSSAISASPSSR
jgi:YidC/Oxa1 family membrane protein insertase